MLTPIHAFGTNCYQILSYATSILTPIHVEERSFCCEIQQIWHLSSFLYAEILGTLDPADLGSYIVILSWFPEDPGSSFFVFAMGSRRSWILNFCLVLESWRSWILAKWFCHGILHFATLPLPYFATRLRDTLYGRIWYQLLPNPSIWHLHANAHLCIWYQLLPNPDICNPPC